MGDIESNGKNDAKEVDCVHRERCCWKFRMGEIDAVASVCIPEDECLQDREGAMSTMFLFIRCHRQ